MPVIHKIWYLDADPDQTITMATVSDANYQGGAQGMTFSPSPLLWITLPWHRVLQIHTHTPEEEG